MSFTVLGYVSPSKSGLHPKAFLQNLKEHPPTAPMILYSDAEHDGVTHSIPNPEEIKKHARSAWAVNNYIFLLGLKLAIKEGVSHILYIEQDCRVSGRWCDNALIEWLSGDRIEMMGSPIIYNPSSGGRLALEAAIATASAWTEMTGFPTPIYQGDRAPVSPGGRVIVYPNGCGAIYSVEFLQECFNGFERDVGRMAATMPPWDMWIGMRAWDKWREQVFNHIAPLPSVYSGYGDSLYTADERKDMLTSGRVNLVHQIKDSWIPAST